VNHADAESHAAFIKKYRFPFPLLVDPEKKTSARYGALKKFFKAIIIKRTVWGSAKTGRSSTCAAACRKTRIS